MLIAARQLGSTLDNREPTSSQAEPYDSIYPRRDPRPSLIGDHTLLVVPAVELVSALIDRETHGLAFPICFAMVINVLEREAD